MGMRDYGRIYGAASDENCHLCGSALLNAVHLDGAFVCSVCLRRIDANQQLKRRIFFRSDVLTV